jgi:hypothetical protein
MTTKTVPPLLDEQVHARPAALAILSPLKARTKAHGILKLAIHSLHVLVGEGIEPVVGHILAVLGGAWRTAVAACGTSRNILNTSSLARWCGSRSRPAATTWRRDWKYVVCLAVWLSLVGRGASATRPSSRREGRTAARQSRASARRVARQRALDADRSLDRRPTSGDATACQR